MGGWVRGGVGTEEGGGLEKGERVRADSWRTTSSAAHPPHPAAALAFHYAGLPTAVSLGLTLSLPACLSTPPHNLRPRLEGRACGGRGAVQEDRCAAPLRGHRGH